MFDNLLKKLGYVRIEELDEANDTIINLNTRVNMYISDYKMMLKEIDSLKNKLKISSGKLGGYTKHNNKLQEENDNLKNEIEILKMKLEESMSDKYLVKKIHEND